MGIREARRDDVQAMVSLSAGFRARLPAWSPRFWRVAAQADTRQAQFFEMLLGLDDVIALLDDRPEGPAGFVIARVMAAPPVYDPGGPVCMIDDFVVPEHAWATRGAALLSEVERRARQRGAVLSVVICPRLAEPKRALLGRCGFDPVSEWHVREL